uniref:Uncharacterized protein n=1 Tax=Solanum lycopersicum TaxID=4081 RepID=A0A3Q7G7K1_SOLLC
MEFSFTSFKVFIFLFFCSLKLFIRCRNSFYVAYFCKICWCDLSNNRPLALNANREPV